MEPQLLPVEKAVNADKTKMTVGRMPIGKRSPRLAIRKSAVCNSALISAMAQDNTRIIMARKVNRAPLTQASTTSSNDNSLCPNVMMTATRADTSDAHISA